MPARKTRLQQQSESPTLTTEDWDFDSVPVDELIACCYWEYARESAFIVDTFRFHRDNWYCPGGKFADWVLIDNRSLERIQSIGNAAQVFMRGWALKRDPAHQSNRPNKANHHHPYAPPGTGSFPEPWQSLAEAERKYRAHIVTDAAYPLIVPIKVAHWSWAKEIARECQITADRQHEERRAWERSYVRRDDKGKFFQLPGAPVPSEIKPIHPGIRWGLGETLLVDIAWEFFTNDEIANYFRRWVKANRPREIPVPSDQGRKRISDRVKLERLAIMRLLHLFPVAALRTRCPEAWKRYNTSNRRWHQDVNKAHAHFHELFPFLSKDESPRSWPPKDWPGQMK